MKTVTELLEEARDLHISKLMEMGGEESSADDWFRDVNAHLTMNGWIRPEDEVPEKMKPGHFYPVWTCHFATKICTLRLSRWDGMKWNHVVFPERTIAWYPLSMLPSRERPSNPTQNYGE